MSDRRTGQRAYTAEQRDEAVALVGEGRSIAGVARELSVGRSALSRWVRAARSEAANPDESPRSGGLSPKQEAALASLLAGGSVTEAAAAAKVERSTCSKWLNHDEGFRASLAKRQEERREAHERLIGGLVGEAAATLRKVMADTAAPHSARVAAAKTVLTLALPRSLEVTAKVKAEVTRAGPSLNQLLGDPAVRKILDAQAREQESSCS